MSRLIIYHRRSNGSRFYSYDVPQDSDHEDDDGRETDVQKAISAGVGGYKTRGPGFYCLRCQGVSLEWDGPSSGPALVDRLIYDNRGNIVGKERTNEGQVCADCIERSELGIPIESRAKR